MALRCARLTCADPAVASTLFVADESRVVLIDLAASTAGIPLCADHARRLTAPVGWDLTDRRSPQRGSEDQGDPWAAVENDPDGSGVDRSGPGRRRDDPIDEAEASATVAYALSQL